MGKAGAKHLTAEDFTQIKTLLSVNVKPRQIRDITSRSFGVIEVVAKAANFKDYKRLRKEASAKYRTPATPVAEPAQAEMPLTPAETAEVVTYGDQIIAALTGINEALVALKENQDVLFKNVKWVMDNAVIDPDLNKIELREEPVKRTWLRRNA